MTKREVKEARHAELYKQAIAAGHEASAGIPDVGAVGWAAVWVPGNTPFAHWLRKTGNGSSRTFGYWGKGTGFSASYRGQAYAGNEAFAKATTRFRSSSVGSRNEASSQRTRAFRSPG